MLSSAALLPGVMLVMLAFVATWLLTALVRRYALARLLDLPTARSSHAVPTPRGGGIGFVLVISAASPLLSAAGMLPWSTTVALAAAGLVAIIGFVDDHRPVSASWRLLVHGIAAAWGLYWLGGLPPIGWGETTIDLGLPGQLLAWIGLIWLLNLYNFMDGIDALAGAQAVTVLAGMALIVILIGPAPPALPLLIAAAAVAGFLLWNLPPARIFMGDVGSGFLGLLLGLFVIAAIEQHPQIVWSWAIMLACFVSDATVTLLRRLMRREAVHQPHRSHAYQRAARRWASHGRVSGTVVLINLLWLLPWAAAVAVGFAHPLIGLIAAYGFVLALTLALGAGSATE